MERRLGGDRSRLAQPGALHARQHWTSLTNGLANQQDDPGLGEAKCQSRHFGPPSPWVTEPESSLAPARWDGPERQNSVSTPSLYGTLTVYPDARVGGFGASRDRQSGAYSVVHRDDCVRRCDAFVATPFFGFRVCGPATPLPGVQTVDVCHPCNRNRLMWRILPPRIAKGLGARHLLDVMQRVVLCLCVASPVGTEAGTCKRLSRSTA